MTASPQQPQTERRFFLAGTPDDGPPRLAPEEARHASTVLRLRPGDPIIGLDGRGNAWPLMIQGIQRGTVEVVENGPRQTCPPPGDPQASTPEVRVAFSMPMGGHLDGLIDRLTQLGVARFAPFVAAHTPVRSRTLTPKLEQRLIRIARTACKQSRRLWEPRIEPLRPLAKVIDGTGNSPRVFLDPGATRSLADWCLGLEATDPTGPIGPSRGITLYVGPEGGFSPGEIEAFASAAPPVQPTWLGPHILRIETATEAAAAVALHHCTRRPPP